MPCVVYKVKFLLPFLLITGLQAQVFHQIDLAGGGTIFLSEDMFQNLRIERVQSVGTVLTGRYQQSRVQFALVFQKVSGEQGLQVLANLLGRPNLTFRPIGDTAGIEGRDVYRLEDVASLRGQLCTLRQTQQFGQKNLFFLIGDETDFYAALPDFLEMVERYQPRSIQTSGQTLPHRWKIAAAISLLVMVVVLVWLVFRRVAQLEEDVEA